MQFLVDIFEEKKGPLELLRFGMPTDFEALLSCQNFFLFFFISYLSPFLPPCVLITILFLCYETNRCREPHLPERAHRQDFRRGRIHRSLDRDELHHQGPIRHVLRHQQTQVNPSGEDRRGNK